MLTKILENGLYGRKAKEAAQVVNSEGGTATAADAIEKALSKDERKAKISVLR
jgi:UDP:flavonoid glycosyltransferase YjiC (YdhE family)